MRSVARATAVPVPTDGKIEPWTKGSMLLLRRGDPRGEHRRRARARRAPGFPSSSRSSRSGCCSAPTGRARSSSTTPSSRATSGSSGSRRSSTRAGSRPRGGGCAQVAVPAALLSTVGVAVTRRDHGVAAPRPLRPHAGSRRSCSARSSPRPTRPPCSRRFASRTSAAGSRGRSRPSPAATTRWRSRSRSV